MEKYVGQENLKGTILSKVDELIDCVQKLGRADFFQITVKHINGEIITKTDFIDAK